MNNVESLKSQLKPVQKNNDFFGHLTLAPPDAILGTALAYQADTHPKKMNLGIGAYRTDEGKPYPFNIVKKVEAEIVADKTLDKEYLPIDGLKSYVTASRNLILGADSDVVKNDKVCSLQALSGTGALRIAFDFFKRFTDMRDIYVPNPTWGNHQAIIKDSGLNVNTYPYYRPSDRGFDFDGMIGFLKQLKAGSVVLLHSCAHNPTGVDPSTEQWRTIAAVVKEQNLFPLFDSAYQGYASGDLEKDAISIRIFQDLGLQMCLTQSFAKNMGLYGERVGSIHFVCTSSDIAKNTLSQVKLIVRTMYSNPPKHGATIASRIMNNPEYFKEWQVELKSVSERILWTRSALRDELNKNGTPGNWDHIVKQIGMFSYTGLTSNQCEVLINKYHIYLLKNGRISMAGITTKNVQYLADAIKDAVTSAQ